jgi:5-methylcytosine-specific restriction endonuclease McrA
MDEAAERFAVWTAWNCRCAYCTEPIDYNLSEKEHLIPKGKADKLDALIKKFDLPCDFEIESFENWVPACRKCNLLKSTRIPDASAAFTLLFVKAREIAPKAKKHADHIVADRKNQPYC